MKLYQFLLLLTFCSALINALYMDRDTPLPEKIRRKKDKKEGLHINIPVFKDVYLTDCRMRFDRGKAYCDFVDKKYRDKKLYVMIPFKYSMAYIEPENLNVATKIVEWYVRDKDDKLVDEVVETGAMEDVEAGDAYHDIILLYLLNFSFSVFILSHVMAVSIIS